MRHHRGPRTVRLLVTLVLGVFLLVALSGAQAQEADEQNVAPADLPNAMDDEPAVSPASPGHLGGRVDIGPLQPVERVGAPRPTPSPAACTSRGLVLLTPDGQTEVMRFSFRPDCTYDVELPPGDYQVQLQAGGIDRSRDLPQLVTIAEGQTTSLDISVDTGIR